MMRKLRTALLLLLIFCATAKTADVNLSWTANSESDLAGYRLYQGTASGVYAVPTQIGLQNSYTVAGLAAGTYYFALSAFDASGNESGKSIEIAVVIPPPPSPPPQVTEITIGEPSIAANICRSLVQEQSQMLRGRDLQSDPIKDRRGCYKRGDPVVAMPDGWSWGRLETIPKFWCVRVPGERLLFMQFVLPELNQNLIWLRGQNAHKLKDQTKRRRRWSFSPELISQSQRLRLFRGEIVNLSWVDFSNAMLDKRGWGGRNSLILEVAA